jgi:hypothetical protein
MELLNQPRDNSDRITIAPPPPSPSIPPTPDRGWADWGLALGVAAWGGSKIWGLFSRQQSADSALQTALIKGLMEQNKMLLEAVMKRP